MPLTILPWLTTAAHTTAAADRTTDERADELADRAAEALALLRSLPDSAQHTELAAIEQALANPSNESATDRVHAACWRTLLLLVAEDAPAVVEATAAARMRPLSMAEAMILAALDDSIAPRLLLVPSDVAQPFVLVSGPAKAHFPLVPRATVASLWNAGFISEVTPSGETAPIAVFRLSPAGQLMLDI